MHLTFTYKSLDPRCFISEFELLINLSSHMRRHKSTQVNESTFCERLRQKRRSIEESKGKPPKETFERDSTVAQKEYSGSDMERTTPWKVNKTNFIKVIFIPKSNALQLIQLHLSIHAIPFGL